MGTVSAGRNADKATSMGHALKLPREFSPHQNGGIQADEDVDRLIAASTISASRIRASSSFFRPTTCENKRDVFNTGPESFTEEPNA